MVKKYTYPILLRNENLEPYKLTECIDIRKITQAERETFFGLKNVKYAFDTQIAHVTIYSKSHSDTSKGMYPNEALFNRGLFDGSSDMQASNYVVHVETEAQDHDQIVQMLNLALKIFCPTSSGCYAGFSDTYIKFTLNYPLQGPFNYIYFEQKHFPEIQQLYFEIQNMWGNGRFSLVASLYDRALQGGKVPLDVRFLLLTIALESLYLPGVNIELQFRLCLRVAKTLNETGYGEKDTVFKEVKQIYAARSKLVHEGCTKAISKEMFCTLTNLVRVSLRTFLQNPGAYTENSFCSIELS
ncbi:HEPN domain-containing protein [Geomonas paludis]|uniref:Uncharacterized protein n=1 Tax=Geomonas paludis TaxID=2740185 RepID=A0A6V8MRE5_9BACT|nr:HEPN domain-containing protein [Geomonas paludis]GFO62686.1 hypothetical protein GMPD_06050 [Geomonas paludis]